MIHWRPETPEPSSRWMRGRATLTTVLSSMAMKRAKHIAPNVNSLVRRSSWNIRPPDSRHRQPQAEHTSPRLAFQLDVTPQPRAELGRHRQPAAGSAPLAVAGHPEETLPDPVGMLRSWALAVVG